ncbi:MAG: hypothetical protein AABW83_01290 [Nanoarchaeota archaeon]
MKINISSLDTVYGILSSIENSNYQDSEDYENDEGIKKGIIFNFRYSPALLKTPLASASIYFKKFPGLYSAVLLLGSLEKNTFLTGRKNFIKKIEKKGYIFMPLNKLEDNYEGYVDFKEHKKMDDGAKFVIREFNNESSLIGICIGTYGSLPAYFPKEEIEFTRSIKSLETLANLLIENIYDLNLDISNSEFPEQAYLSF